MSSDFPYRSIDALDLTMMRGVLASAGFWTQDAATPHDAGCDAARFVISQFQQGVRTPRELLLALSQRAEQTVIDPRMPMWPPGEDVFQHLIAGGPPA